MYAALAAAIAVPSLLVLYFLKLKRQELEISSTLLWKKAIQDLQANAPFQKLRRNILLLLQLLVLAGAILALGQPQLNATTTSGGRQVILIDRSASMAAMDAEIDGKPVSRLDAAKNAAAHFVSGLKEPGLLERESGDAAMVLAFDREAQMVQQFTGDKTKLADAIRAITVTDGPSMLEPAVRLARAQAPKLIITDTRNVDGKEVDVTQVIEGISDKWPIALHVFTDGKLPDASKALPGPMDTITFHRFGKVDTDNVGIVALRADRQFEFPSKIDVFANVQSTRKTPTKVDVELRVDGVPAGRRELVIPPADDKGPGTRGISFPLERPESVAIEVSLHEPGVAAVGVDAFATDDRGWLVIPPARGLKLCVVTNGNLLLRQALAALPQSGEPIVYTPAEYQSALKSGAAFDFDVVIVDGADLLWNGKQGALPPGRFLFFGSLPSVPPAAAGQTGVGTLGPVIKDAGETGPVNFVSWKRDHRALRSLNMDTVDVFKSRKIDVPEGSSAQVLAETTAGPAIVELSTADSRAIVVGFNPLDSDWPYDVGFIIFLSYATDYLGTGGGWAVARSTQPGLTVSDRIPDNAKSLLCRDESGNEVGAGRGPDGSVSFGPFPRVGLYTASWTGGAGAGDRKSGDRVSRDYAVNLLDPLESDVRAAQELSLATSAASAEGQTGKATRTLWPWLLLAALCIVMLEWYIYNRKVHV